MADRFVGHSTITSSATKHFAVTPHDETTRQFPFVPKAIYVGTAGDVNCSLIDEPENFCVYKAVNSDILSLRVACIKATGTTATGIILLG